MKPHPLRRTHPVIRRPTTAVGRALPPLYRVLWDEGADLEGAGELARSSRMALVEAALFASDEPLTPRRIAVAAGLEDVAEVRQLVDGLRQLYDSDETAFQVEEIGGGYQLLTRPKYHAWLVRLRSGGSELKLTNAARETLTIVAYRQPITRADIESIRGVRTGEILRQLMEKGLLRIAGRDNSLGRPVLYGTTKKFLQLFGLKSLRDLPPWKEPSKS